MLPTRRITLNRAEITAIIAGLNIVVNGVAEIMVNKRRPPDMLYPNVSSKYQPRNFNQELYTSLLALRSRLADSQHPTNKFRLNHIEYSIVAFGVRIGRSRFQEEEADTCLGDKLETYRRRAMRATKTSLGDSTYLSTQQQWREFSNWIRFNVLPLRVPRKPTARRYHAEQRRAILSLAEAMIKQRCKKPISAAKLEHLVELAIREIRRKRHEGVKVRELVAHPEAAHDFLFDFVRKRVPDLEVKYDYLTWCEKTAVNGELFKIALSLPRRSGEVVRTELGAISETKVVARIAKFFRDNLHPDDWELVKDQVDLMSRSFSVESVCPKGQSLEEVLASVKPQREITDLPDHFNFIVDWLLAFLVAINASPQRAADLVHAGWVLARRNLPAEWKYLPAEGSIDISEAYEAAV
jgi:hypothetical protein